MQAVRINHSTLAFTAVVLGFIAVHQRLYLSGTCALTLAVVTLVAPWIRARLPVRKPPLVRIGSAHLSEGDFCRHGIVVGMAGTGKTEFAKRLLIELVTNAPDAGIIMTDEKGDLHYMVRQVLAALGRADKLVELRPGQFAGHTIGSRHCMNLIGDRSVSWQTHAQLMVDAAVSQGQKTNQAYFKTQAIDRIAQALETLHLAGVTITFPALYDFFQLPELGSFTVEKMMNRDFEDPATKRRTEVLYDGWRQFQEKAPEELSGIRGTIENYTNAYREPSIAETFSAEVPTVGIDALDQGKVMLISVPQDFVRARRYILAMCKILYYRSALGRFDRYTPEEMRRANLHVGLFDEAQNSLLASEEGYSDFNSLDKMRAARCPVWMMMQCYTSAVPALEQESKLDVLRANLGTHVIFRLASEKGAKLASGLIGEKEVLEVSRSVTRGVTTVSRTPKVKPVLNTSVFRTLRDFDAIVRHANDRRDFHRVTLRPLTDDGRHTAPWYWAHRLMN